MTGPSPFFGEWTELGQERPRRAVLVMEVPQFIGNRGWLDEELVRRLTHAFAHARHIDHGVDQDIGDVQRADAIRRTRQRDDAKSLMHKAPDDRGSRAGADTRYNSDWFVSHRCLAKTID